MRTLTVLGAGQSAPFLIRYLLDQARDRDLTIQVADRDLAAAEQRIAGHPRGRALALDITDAERRRGTIDASDLVINLMPPPFQLAIARDCIDSGSPMVSASYLSPAVAKLAPLAEEREVLLLCEMGLDPGIDLMTASEIFRRIRAQGGEVESFVSYGAGLPEPGVETNPLGYCITWNPRNVVMSAEHGAEYLEDGKIKISPWHRVFDNPWPIEVPGLGLFDAYPNRDSLSYRETLGIENTKTLIRGTLRYPGWCRFWHQIVRLGLPDEGTTVPGLAKLSFSELLEMFLPAGSAGEIKQRTAEFLGLGVEDEAIRKMDWLGLFSDQAIGEGATTPAEAMVQILRRRLPLPPGVRDMVLLHHEIEASYLGEGRRERILSTFTDFGQPGGHTAMSRTVGLPAAIGGLLLLDGKLPPSGCRIPTEPEIYEPILAALRAEGLEFRETVTPLPMEAPEA